VRLCNTVSINCLWEYHHIYNLVAVGQIDEMIRFWGSNAMRSYRTYEVLEFKTWNFEAQKVLEKGLGPG